MLLTVKIDGKDNSGSAVAVTRNRALTALHGHVKLNHEIALRTRNGTILKGKIEFVRFTRDVVDIAVILLDDGSFFEHYIPWSDEPVYLTQPILVVGLRYSHGTDMVMPYARTTNVDMIENGDSTLFQATYYNFNGCSGTGVVTSLRDGVCEVVGVHIASHDDSSLESPKKKKKIMNELEASVSSKIHGDSAYSLVCEIARVPELIAHLNS